ncbi:hypothetical protein [Pistricoccus aurantiacus]|uniref:hypothetical protein n=1 Tax=Pistricoccus aurantiacus TaxID=1883414 RepID=UPI00363E56E2
MNFFYLMPFSYFFYTRLRGGSIAFHLIFEWLAAAILVLAIGISSPLKSLIMAGLSYLAFISLYEIGYLINDLYAANKEIGGRKRGPRNVSRQWIWSWFGSRLLVFLGITVLLGFYDSLGWWLFFLALCIVFALHNVLEDKELKAATFLWLAWFRFMAPVIFVVEDSQLFGVGMAAAMSYAGFRLFGYLDSKRLLSMPGRQRGQFRLFFFLMPLAGAVALWPYSSAQGFLILTIYFAVAATVGTMVDSVLTHAPK